MKPSVSGPRGSVKNTFAPIKFPPTTSVNKGQPKALRKWANPLGAVVRYYNHGNSGGDNVFNPARNAGGRLLGVGERKGKKSEAARKRKY